MAGITALQARGRSLAAAGLERHPILAVSAVLLLTGGGMLLAVCFTVLLITLPLGALLGWL